jgi:hypothetical protein
MQTLWDSVKLGIAWVLTLIAGVTLDQMAMALAIVYSALQISAFIYPWHKKLWKYFGVSENDFSQGKE